MILGGPAPATVKCGSCTLCCHGELIELVPEMGDNPDQFLTELRPSALGRPGLAHVLPHRDGHCYYLVDGKCAVYDRRPHICRTFSCVDFYRSRPRPERRRMEKASEHTRTIFTRARELIEKGEA